MRSHSIVPKYARDILYFFSGTFIARLSGFISTVVMTRGLSSADFSIVALFLRLIEYILNFTRLGIGNAIQVLIAKNVKDLDHLRYLTVAILFQIFAISTLLIFYFFWNDLFKALVGQDEINIFFPYLVFAVVMTSFTYVFDGALKGLGLFNNAATVVASSAIIELILIFLVIGTFGMNGVIIVFTLGRLFTLLIFSFFIYNYISKTNGLKLFSRLPSALSDSLKVGLPFALVMVFQGAIGIYILNLLTNNAPLEQVGYLRLIGAIGTLIVLIPNTVVPVFISNAANISNEESKKLTFFNNNIKFVFYISVISILLIFPYLEFLTQVLFGYEYEILNNYFILACCLPLATNIFNIVSSYFLALKDMKWFSFIFFIWASASLAFGSILVPTYQLHGFIFTEMISFSLAFLVGYTKINYVLSKTKVLFELFKILTCLSLTLFIIVFLTNLDNFYIKLIISISSSISFIFYFYYFELSENLRFTILDYLNFKKGSS